MASRFLVLVLALHGSRAVTAEMNVYDQPMTQCGSNHANGCTYVAYDAGAHEVCVTQLPHGFSSDTGQGPWSDQFTGQPWCICIWAYSNYILQHKDLSLKCESIPDKVLEEQYSMDKFKQCGSMSSTQGCGAEDIRRSIQSLCQQCDGQAKDQTSKSALKSKCDKILNAAPHAAMQRLDDVVAVEKAATRLHGMGSTSPFAFVGGMLAVAGLLVCNVLALRRSNTQEATASQEEATAEQREDLLVE